MLVNSSNAVSDRFPGVFEFDFFAPQSHGAFFRLVDAGDDLDEGRLASTIFSHQGMDLACFELEMHLIQRLDAGKDLGDPR